jgi:ubiquinone/menaquinone biosynthesis C-methylase UbiE
MSTVLHEMSGPVRSAVISESKRVLKPTGRILWIDFHPGPYLPLKGWLQKLVIIVAEISAGREHFRNYRDFIAKKGLETLARQNGLHIEKQKNVGGNTMSVCLLVIS